MAPSDNPKWLSAAECAARTGLTVRALRVYEREGLINPPRAPNGWRRYGATELARLNSIVILKELGLTLIQIRTLLTEHSPSLLRILEIQEAAWRTKRDTATRALTLLEAAQKRLRAEQSLAVDELCDLIQGLEPNRSRDMTGYNAVMRELINMHTTPNEERQWTTWWTQHPEDLAESQAFIADQNVLFEELQPLADANADPASPEVQAMLTRHNELLLRYHVRERGVRQLTWNSDITRKFWGLGAKASRQDDARSRRSVLYGAAIHRSAWGEALTKLVNDTQALADSGVDPASSTADEVIERLRTICRDYALGDPYIYTQWSPFMEHVYNADASVVRSVAWQFLAQALIARKT